MTSVSLVIRKMSLFFVLPRQRIDNSSHFDFSCFSAERRACKNFSGLTSYFTERKARYSPIDGLYLIFIHLLPYFMLIFVSKPFSRVSSITNMFMCDFSFTQSNTKLFDSICIRYSFANQNNLEKKQTHVIADLTLPLKNSNGYINIRNRLY